MGKFNQIHAEILSYKAAGRTIEDTYIYFKDYVEFEDLVAVWESR